MPTKVLTISQDHIEQRFELEIFVDEIFYNYSLRVEYDRVRSRMRIHQESLMRDDKQNFEFESGNSQLCHDDYSQGASHPFDWARSGAGEFNETPDYAKPSQFMNALTNL